ncbi:MAG: SDR family NAD(P)-dependent oxidoreductase [Pseudomonadota bacterium]
MGIRDLNSILITGGSFGLGFEMARRFVDRGFTVFVCGRSQNKLDSAVAACPALLPIQADITDGDDRNKIFDTIEAKGSPLEILINNAAVCYAHDYANPFTLAEDRALTEIETNFHAPVELCRLFLKRRNSEREGVIVNVSTPGAFFALEANPLYTASKAGFHNFTLALAQHLRETNVKVLEIFPPALATGLTAELEVDAEDDNGPEALQSVAEKSVEGVLAGEPCILPHEQSAALVESMGGTGKVFTMDMVGVRRKAGWDR